MDPEKPFRILVTIKSASEHYPKVWSNPHAIVELALGALRFENGISLDQTSSAKLLAIQTYDSKARLVFDMFHDSYNPRTAHLPGQSDLPVWTVTVDKRMEKDIIKTFLATGNMKSTINRQVRRIHGSSALEKLPPFWEDYTNHKTPVSINPRCPEGIKD